MTRENPFPIITILIDIPIPKTNLASKLNSSVGSKLMMSKDPNLFFFFVWLRERGSELKILRDFEELGGIQEETRF